MALLWPRDSQEKIAMMSGNLLECVEKALK